MSIFVSILGLGLLILIHEAGHFFVARAVGMNPRKFYLGFPPAVVKARRNGIEYGVGAIPLGGYVKIPGMHRPAAGDLDIYFDRAKTEAPSLNHPVEDLVDCRRHHAFIGGAQSEAEPVVAAHGEEEGGEEHEREQQIRSRTGEDHRDPLPGLRTPVRVGRERVVDLRDPPLGRLKGARRQLDRLDRRSHVRDGGA